MKSTRIQVLFTAATLVASACSDDQSPPRVTVSEAVTGVSIERGTDTFDLRGFDVHGDRATASLLGLGFDAEIGWDGAVTYRPTVGSNDVWQYQLTPTMARQTQQLTLNATSVTRRGPDLWLQNADVRQRMTHHAEGLGLSYVISTRLPGDGPLELAYRGAGHEHRLVDGTIRVLRGAREVFRWQTFKAWDANGKTLPVTFGAEGDRFWMDVDDQAATYPITIDPISTTPFWSGYGDTALSRFGFSVATADVTGDNLADVLVAQQRYSAPEFWEGRVLMFPGTATGVSATAAWSYESNQEDALLGSELLVVENANGDALADFAFSAPFWDSSLLDVGRIYVVPGAGTLTTTPATIDGTVAETFLGDALAAGDFNCDGLTDLASGEPDANNGDGTAHLLLNAAGTYSLPALPFASGAANAAENLGAALAFTNVNGDTSNGASCDELIVASPSYDLPGNNQGRLAVYASAAVPGTPTFLSSGSNNSRMGESLLGGLDINGDGYEDLVAGAPTYTGTLNQEGGAFVFLGAAAGLQQPTAIAGGSAGSYAGHALAAGDVNNDGYDDIVVGANAYTATELNEGRLLVFQGKASGIHVDPVTAIETNTVNAFLGDSVASGVDLNGDGIHDVLGGARAYPDPNNTANLVGAVFAYAGNLDCYVDDAFFAHGAQNPSNPCQICDTATSRTAWTDRADSTACDDGDACTLNETCQSGVCSPASTVVCADGNACTNDTCDPMTGQCVFDAATLEGTSCALFDACLLATCQAGACTQTGITGCFINNTCYAEGAVNPANTCESCVSASSSSAWTVAGDGAACDDGLFCTVSDVCAAGTCAGAARDCSSAAAECFDAVACDEANDACVPATPTAANTACGGSACMTNSVCDGNGTCMGAAVDCTNLDTACTVGVCNPTSGTCEAVNVENGTSCDDGDPCTVADACTSGVCGGGAKDCSQLDSECSQGTCNAVSGACEVFAINDGQTCDDGDACTQNDVCEAGACGGTTLDCDDGNPCTDDTCDAATGCTFAAAPNGADCTDGLECTDDVCEDGSCVAQQVAGCIVDNACVSAGAASPDSPCMVCNPAVAADAYSPAATGTACSLNTCSDDGSAVLAGACDAVGECAPDAEARTECGDYLCASGACLTTCSTAAECADGLDCVAGACVAGGEDMGPDTGDAGPTDDAGQDMDSDLRGSGCACSSAATPLDDASWLLALVGIAALGRRR